VRHIELLRLGRHIIVMRQWRVHDGAHREPVNFAYYLFAHDVADVCSNIVAISVANVGSNSEPDA
jgi:hypothetical protein